MKVLFRSRVKLNNQFFLCVKSHPYYSQLYVLTILTISLLYFVVTGIQFWGSDYLISVIKAD